MDYSCIHVGNYSSMGPFHCSHPTRLTKHLAGQSHCDFLQQQLHVLLDVSLGPTHCMWFLHGGELPHFRRVVRGCLDELFLHKCMVFRQHVNLSCQQIRDTPGMVKRASHLCDVCRCAFGWKVDISSISSNSDSLLIHMQGYSDTNGDVSRFILLLNEELIGFASCSSRHTHCVKGRAMRKVMTSLGRGPTSRQDASSKSNFESGDYTKCAALERAKRVVSDSRQCARVKDAGCSAQDLVSSCETGEPLSRCPKSAQTANWAELSNARTMVWRKQSATYTLNTVAEVSWSGAAWRPLG
ncbi:hypothetical protein PR048_003787 [Dryococelus australis]|uniref:Uncharacterized protein n=1 Tax=Dryococelus australis TaxID=614101 RepID=A0ABQ9IP61_9NEOP|nr:hypothetical protein PR048_003787 [Dryococelus australis]